MGNGPFKNEKVSENSTKSRNLAQPTNGSRSLRFAPVGHVFAFLSSHYAFSPRARILKRQSRRVSDLPFATFEIGGKLSFHFTGLYI